MSSPRRIDIKKILRDPAARREMMVATLIATQAREGIDTTREQAEAAYDKVLAEKRKSASAPLDVSAKREYRETMMAFKVNKKARAKLAELRDEVDKRAEQVRMSVEDLRAGIELLKAAIEEQADEFDGEFDERSDAWKEGDRGSEVEGFVSAWREAADALENFECEDVTGDLEELLTSIDELPDQPS